MGATYQLDQMHFALDFGVNFVTEESIYDLYAGLMFKMPIIENLDLEIKGFGLFDINGEEIRESDGDTRGLNPTIGLYPRVVYTWGKAQFGAGLKLQKCFDGDFGYGFFSLPVSWKYTY